MSLTTYLKRKMAMLSLALSKVESSTLNQSSDALGSDTNTIQSYNQGSMADALLRGEITTSVKEMRWRMYKILDETDKLKVKIVGYDEYGLPITEISNTEKLLLKNVIKDDFDEYDVEMVFKNDDIVKSTHEIFSNDNLNSDNLSDDKHDLIGTETFIGRTLGELSFDDMVSNVKMEKSIVIERDFLPKFKIEDYTKKLIIRKINENEKLLEFYISKYPDDYDRKTIFLIKEIEKIIKTKRISDLTHFDKVAFLTHKTIGVRNGLEFIYQINKFDKIIEFNGHYVIKFIATPLVNGDYIYDKFKLDDLEKRYEKKERKN